MMITNQELHSIITECSQIGAMKAIKAIEPAADWVRIAELKRWAKLNGLDQKTLNTLIKEEKIRPIRIGEGRNSPKVYSKVEIKEAFASLTLVKIQTKELL